MTVDVFGNYIDVDTVEQAVVATLQRWLPDGIAHQERRKNLPTHSVPRPRNIDRRSEFDLENGEQLPAIVLRSTGTVGGPDRDQRGHRKTWRIEVAAINRGRNETEARLLGSIYLAAIAHAFELDPTLGGAVERVREAGPDDLAYGSTGTPGDDARSIYGTTFEVTARVVTDVRRPTDPSDDPYVPSPPFPSLLEAVIDVSISDNPEESS
jgi:hypothetical protein